jgi:hypothetical protein
LSSIRADWRAGVDFSGSELESGRDIGRWASTPAGIAVGGVAVGGIGDGGITVGGIAFDGIADGGVAVGGIAFDGIAVGGVERKFASRRKNLSWGNWGNWGYISRRSFIWGWGRGCYWGST